MGNKALEKTQFMGHLSVILYEYLTETVRTPVLTLAHQPNADLV